MKPLARELIPYIRCCYCGCHSLLRSSYSQFQEILNVAWSAVVSICKIIFVGEQMVRNEQGHPEIQTDKPIKQETRCPLSFRVSSRAGPLFGSRCVIAAYSHFVDQRPMEPKFPSNSMHFHARRVCACCTLTIRVICREERTNLDLALKRPSPQISRSTRWAIRQGGVPWARSM